jgi:hypothetical protein
MKNSVFWNIKQYSPFKVNPRFGGKCRLHYKSRRANQERKEHEAGSKVALQAYSSVMKMEVIRCSE